MRVYLDTSVYNRPFNDQAQLRIWFETLAFSLLLQWIEEGSLDLAISSVLRFENSRNPFPWRRQWVTRCCSLATYVQKTNKALQDRARELEKEGLKPIDALHLASAEGASCDYFITCDDRIVKHYTGRSMQVMAPLDFVLKTQERGDGHENSP